jgi:hypothetical protein
MIDVVEKIASGEFVQAFAVKDKPVTAAVITAEMADVIARDGLVTVVLSPTGELLPETINKGGQVGDYLVVNQVAGYRNEYIVPAQKFGAKYSLLQGNLFAPVEGPKTVYMVPREHPAFELEVSWGGNMHVFGGAAIIPDGDGFYAVNPHEFEATYSIIE